MSDRWSYKVLNIFDSVFHALPKPASYQIYLLHVSNLSLPERVKIIETETYSKMEFVF